MIGHMRNRSAGVLSVAQAIARGISWRRLQRSDWQRVGPGQYTRPHEADIVTRLTAVSLRLPAGAAFAGRTAGWLHGLELPPCSPVEAIAPLSCRISARAGVSLRRAQLEFDEIVDVKGLPVTNPIRTVVDLAFLLPLPEAVAAADAALHQKILGVEDLELAAVSREGRQGVKRLRQVIELAEPLSESPMETRLRLVLISGGLPRPQAQAALTDRSGSLIGRADLFYPERSLVLEYDGATHKESLVEDSRRQNRLIEAGYQLLRFTGADVLNTPQALVAQVRRGLAGWPANR